MEVIFKKAKINQKFELVLGVSQWAFWKVKLAQNKTICLLQQRLKRPCLEKYRSDSLKCVGV